MTERVPQFPPRQSEFVYSTLVADPYANDTAARLFGQRGALMTLGDPQLGRLIASPAAAKRCGRGRLT